MADTGRSRSRIDWRLSPPRVAWAGVVAAIGMWAGGCSEGPGDPTDVVAGQFGGSVAAVAAADDVIWYAAGWHVQSADIADPRRPVPLGRTEGLGQAARALALVGAHLLVADGTNGLLVYDVSEPRAPTRLATVPTEWSVNDVAVVADRAFLAEGARGLRILDLSDPSSPEPLGRAETPGDALAVAVAGDRAYVADWGTGVRVVDVSDPTAPAEIAALDTAGEAVDVAVSAGLLLVADRQGGLRVYEISDAGRPAALQSVALPGPAERVAAAGRTAFVACGRDGLFQVDLAADGSAEVSEPLPSVAVAMDVLVQDDWLYGADAGAAVPEPRDTRDDLWARMHQWVVEGVAEGALGLAGVVIAEVNPSGKTRAVGMVPSPSLVEAIVGLPDAPVLLAADGHAGLVAIDATDPRAMAVLGVLDLPGPAHDVILDGDRALVACGPGGLAVLDASDPAAVRRVAIIDTPGEATGVAVRGDTAYVADGEAGLRVIDLRGRREVAHVDTPGYAWDVRLDGDRAFVSDRPGGMRVFSLDAPGGPREVARVLHGEADVLDVVVEGQTAWVCAGPAGLLAYDVASPTPRKLGQLILQDRAIGVVVDGARAYVAAANAGVRVVDVSDATAMREVGSVPAPGASERLALHGDWLYIAAEMGGLLAVPVRDLP